MRKIVLQIIRRAVAVVLIVGGSGCASSGLYSKVPPQYDLAAHQDKKVLIWVEAPHSSGADADAPQKVAEAIRDHLRDRAGIKPYNIKLYSNGRGDAEDVLQRPESAARQAGAGLVMIVRIEEYELVSMRIRNLYAGRMLTRTLLLDAASGEAVWPAGGQGKVHDIAVELGQGDRIAVLSQMAASTAHCICRNLYPILKMHYKNSDERISVQEAFEMETY